MNLNDFYNEIKSINDANSLKSLIQNAFKTYCTNQTITTEYIKEFTGLVFQSINNFKGNSVDEIDNLRKLIISIGLIARYSPYINSFKTCIDKIVNEILLVTLKFNKDVDYENIQIRALYIETIRSYTLILQAYEEHMEKYSPLVIESLINLIDDGLLTIQVSSEIEQYSITSIIELVGILIQTCPSLILNNFKLINYFINVCLNLDIQSNDQIFNELITVIGHYLQLFISVPFESLQQPEKVKNKQQQEKDEDSDEEDNNNEPILTPEQKQEQLKIKRAELSSKDKLSLDQSIKLAEKVLSAQDHWKKESIIILLGIIVSFSSIHHYSECQSVVEYIFNQFSDKFNENIKTIINCLSYIFSNTPRELEIIQQYLPVFFNKTTLFYTNLKIQSKDNPTNKTLRNELLNSKEIVCNSIGKMLLIFDSFFDYAEDFISFAYVLAEPIILSNFLYALTYQLESSTSLDIKQQFDQIYLPKVMNPLISQLKSKYQSSIKLSLNILKSLNNISTFGIIYIKDYYSELIEIIGNILKYGWKSFLTYSIDSISVLSKITINGDCNQEQFEKIYKIFASILTDQMVIEEDDQGIDFDLLNRSKFIVLEEISSFLDSSVNGTCYSKQLSPRIEQLSLLFKYLIGNIGVVEVTFDSDLYLRMSQITTLNSLLAYLEKNHQQTQKDYFETTVNSLVNELELINVMDDDEQQETLLDHLADLFNSNFLQKYKDDLKKLLKNRKLEQQVVNKIFN